MYVFDKLICCIFGLSMFPKDEYAELPPQADENDEKMNKRTKEFNKLIIAREKM